MPSRIHGVPISASTRHEGQHTPESGVASQVKCQQVAGKQLDFLYQHLPSSLVATVALSLLLFFFLKDFSDQNVLRIWLALTLFVVLLRSVSIILYSKGKRQSSFNGQLYERMFIVGVAAAGMAWGSMGWWIYPMTEDAGSQMFIFLILIGVTGGSVASLAYRRFTVYLFLCLVLFPLFFGLYNTANQQKVALAFALGTYIIFLLKNGHLFQKNNEQMLILKENALLDKENLHLAQLKEIDNGLYLDSILQSSTETAIVATDTDFRINYFNPKAELIFGIDKENALGSTLMEIHNRQGFGSAGMGRFHQIVQQVRQTGSCPLFEMQIGAIFIETRISSIKNHTGAFAGFLLLANDVTERTKVNDQLRKLSRAVEQSHSTIVITDLDANIEFANPAFSNSTGYTLEEALGQNPRILSSGQQGSNFYQEMWDTLMAGRVWQGEMHNKRKDGSLYWEFATISPVKDKNDKTTHYVAVKEDVTARKEAEHFIEENRKQLSESNRQLEAAKDTAEKMSREAERANQAKSSFLANMSHEIRTPMNSIIGRTALALDNNIDQETRSHLEMIGTSSENLLALINDILDFSKIEAGELNIDNKPFDLFETIESCFKTMNILVEEQDRGVELSWHLAPEVPHAVIGDALRVRQILLNLLGNSVKFTKKGGISLRVNSLLTDGSLKLQFTVEDSGTGIASDKLEHIFNEFSQEDSSITRQFGGTGLGLTICRQLCQLMGGEIEAESTLGQGSSFTFTLPFQPCSSKDIPVQKEPGKVEQISLPSLSILLVEDNEANRILATMVLEKGGHRVTEAHDGLHALNLLVRDDFDLVLMDVQMPIMDGLSSTRIIYAAKHGDKIADVDQDLAEKLAVRLSGSKLPVIAMTANAMAGDRERCLNAGMDDYLTKPLRQDDLQRKLKKWTGNTTAVHGVSGVNPVILIRIRQEVGNIDGILKKYSQCLPDDVSRLVLLTEKGEITEIASQAHKMKGAAITYGAELLADLCQQLETSVCAGGITGVKGLLEQITAESRCVLDALLSETGENES